jgi:HSP20 family protein
MTIRDLVPWTRRDDGLVPFGQFDRLFDDFMSGWNMPMLRSMESSAFSPLDVHETDKSIEVSVELPGMKEKDVDISVDRNVLTISGEKRYEREEDEKERGVYRLERRYGSFQRSLVLPEGIDVDKADATFSNGVLTISLPKSESYRQPVRKLTVRKEDGAKTVEQNEKAVEQESKPTEGSTAGNQAA